MRVRDYLLLAIVGGLVPAALASPYVGILTWVWLGLMNPHRSTWGLAQTIHLSVVIAIPTIISTLREYSQHRLPRERETTLLIALWGMFTITTLFSVYPDLAWPEWEQISKIFLMTLVTAFIVDTKKRLHGYVYVVAFSVGIYGIFGGFFTLATGGQYRVYGPEYSFLGDNNALGLALNMTLPMFFYLARDAQQRLVKGALIASFLLTIIAVIGTLSRGAALGLVAVLGLLLLKSRPRYWAVAALVIALAAPVIWVNMPETWTRRMTTMQTYEQDQSAMARIHAWTLAWRIALANPLLGGGFEIMEDKGLYDIYYPESPTRGDVHSVYFEVISEHGFITFGIFLALMATPLLGLRRIRRAARARPEWLWAVNYCNMVEVSLLGYLVSGAFLELSTFDYVYTLLAISMITKNLVKAETPASTNASISTTGEENKLACGLIEPDRSMEKRFDSVVVYS